MADRLRLGWGTVCALLWGCLATAGCPASGGGGPASGDEALPPADLHVELDGSDVEDDLGVEPPEVLTETTIQEDAEDIQGVAPVAERDPLHCVSDGGDGWVDLPEASAALRLPDGTLLITADSSHRGRGLFITADGTAHPMTFPLDGPTHPISGEFTDDDIEGLDLGVDGRVYGLTSAGWMRVWERDGLTLSLLQPSWAIASDPAWVCENRAVNCGPNYEGLCLRPAGAAPFEGPTASCVGFAASRARSELICLTLDDEGRLTADVDRVIATPLTADHLSDCAFAPPDETDGRSLVLLAGNLYARSALWWFDEEAGTFTETGLTGAANQEALVSLGAERWKSLGDLQTITPDSPWVTFLCGAAAAALDTP